MWFFFTHGTTFWPNIDGGIRPVYSRNCLRTPLNSRMRSTPMLFLFIVFRSAVLSLHPSSSTCSRLCFVGCWSKEFICIARLPVCLTCTSTWRCATCLPGVGSLLRTIASYCGFYGTALLCHADKVSSMHFPQHRLCTRNTELSLEVKFDAGVHLWADELKRRQMRFPRYRFLLKEEYVCVCVCVCGGGGGGGREGCGLPIFLDRYRFTRPRLVRKDFFGCLHYMGFYEVPCIFIFIWRGIPIFSSQAPLWYLSGHPSCSAGSVGIGTYKATSVGTCKYASTSRVL